MKKKGLLLVVTLLALSGLMAAMAYSTAVVRNGSQIVINNSNKALLEIASAGGSSNDGTVQIVDGEAVFNFGRGKDGKMFGFQPDSTYFYEYFMHVKNNTANPVEVEIRLQDFGAYAQFITIKGAPGHVLVQNGVTVGKMLLDSNRDHWNLSLTIDVPSSEVLQQLGVKVSSTPFTLGTIIVDSVTK